MLVYVRRRRALSARRRARVHRIDGAVAAPGAPSTTQSHGRFESGIRRRAVLRTLAFESLANPAGTARSRGSVVCARPRRDLLDPDRREEATPSACSDGGRADRRERAAVGRTRPSDRPADAGGARRRRRPRRARWGDPCAAAPGCGAPSRGRGAGDAGRARLPGAGQGGRSGDARASSAPAALTPAAATRRSAGPCLPTARAATAGTGRGTPRPRRSRCG